MTAERNRAPRSSPAGEAKAGGERQAQQIKAEDATATDAAATPASAPSSPPPLADAPLSDLDEEARERALEQGRRLFARPPVFLKGVTDMRDLPPPHEVEIAFAGRSNVGKSSLINALFNRRDVARTSNTPGRTRELNYFALAEGRMALVDMPGYGYAKAPKSLVKRWQALVRDFLRGRAPLRRVFVLIDARHGLKAHDLAAMDLLDEAAVNYQVVLTKADKARADHLEKLRISIARALTARPAAHPVVHVTSARKGTGLAELRAEIARLLKAT